MNLGQAVAVCLYEIGRSPAVSSGSATDEPASGAALERIAASLNRLLAASGYTKPGTHEATETHVREMLRRMRIRQADADLLTGMLAKLLYSRREP
jgi:tRNA C32,U32 (ribose-2'-O)-methylase TrmJ